MRRSVKPLDFFPRGFESLFSQEIRSSNGGIKGVRFSLIIVLIKYKKKIIKIIQSMFNEFIFETFEYLFGFFLPLLLATAYLTLFERKILAAIQRRKGPKIVGFLGLLQPLVDGIKLLLKEAITPRAASEDIFLNAPILTFLLCLCFWAVMPYSYNAVSVPMRLGILYVFAISSLNALTIIIAGWSSNNRYAFLGALRAASQLISYELNISLAIVNIGIITGSFDLTEIVNYQQHIWFIFPLFPVFLIFFISTLAETHRTPFCLPEAEGELVAGYNVEYSSIMFALFFISEYANIIFMSKLIVLLFLGG